jgi:hypothetical protein
MVSGVWMYYSHKPELFIHSQENVEEFLCINYIGSAARDWCWCHDDFRGDTVVVHPTARQIENHRALQKGGEQLLIHAMYYESRINMDRLSFFNFFYHAQIRAHSLITQRNFYCLHSNKTCFLIKKPSLRLSQLNPTVDIGQENRPDWIDKTPRANPGPLCLTNFKV